VTIREAAATQAKLADFLRRHDVIELDCAGVTETDLTLVQLLLAARKSAERAGKSLVLAAPASGALLAVLSQGGFLPGLGGADEAFWLKRSAAR